VFDVGISKLLIILAVALIVLGPEKLPAVAGQIGRWLGRARTMARQFRDQLEEEASSLQNVKRSFNAALDPNSTAVPAATAAAANLKQPVAGASLDAASQTAEGHAAGIPPGSGALPEADLPQPVFREPNYCHRAARGGRPSRRSARRGGYGAGRSPARRPACARVCGDS
jgi:sec-independent protein translocase protein TatB